MEWWEEMVMGRIVLKIHDVLYDAVVIGLIHYIYVTL